jgi:hypothetical protein
VRRSPKKVILGSGAAYSNEDTLPSVSSILFEVCMLV